MKDTTATAKTWITVSMRMPIPEADELRAVAKASTRSMASQALHYCRVGMARDRLGGNPFLKAGEDEQ